MKSDGFARSAIGGMAISMLNILSVIIHVMAIILAFKLKGFLAAVVTFLLPVASEIYWFFVVGTRYRFGNNAYCIAIYAWIACAIIAAMAAWPRKTRGQ